MCVCVCVCVCEMRRQYILGESPTAMIQSLVHFETGLSNQIVCVMLVWGLRSGLPWLHRYILTWYQTKNNEKILNDKKKVSNEQLIDISSNH